jgi:hypothetical protein
MPNVTRDGPPENYIAVPPELWKYIPAASHVICIRTDGAVKAGFVERHFKSTERRGVTLRSSPTLANIPGVKRASIDFEQIDLIYKKYSQADFIELIELRNSIRKLEAEVEKLKDKLK